MRPAKIPQQASQGCSTVSACATKRYGAHVQAIQKNAEPMAHDLTQRMVQPASQAAENAEPAARQLADEGIRPAAKIVAQNAEPSEQMHRVPALSCMMGLLRVHSPVSVLRCT